MSKFQLSPGDVEWLRKAIRQASIKWPGRAACLRRARKRVLVRRAENGNPIYKYHWQCAVCLKWTKNEKLMEVDHVIEIGSFNGDWNEYLFRHFPRDPRGLQAICVPCHLKKTKAFNSARSKWTRKNKSLG